MLRTTKSIMINGTSVIQGDGEEENQVASMSASIDENGKICTSTNIYNQDVFRENRNTVLSDINEFNERVYSEEVRE